MDLGDKLKNTRGVRGMSTTELANMAKLSQSYISAIENGSKKNPSKKALDRLAKALRVPTSYFLEEDIVTPFDLLEDVPGEIKDFMLNLDNLPYLKLSQKAKENGISPEMVEGLINTLIDAMSRRNRKED